MGLAGARWGPIRRMKRSLLDLEVDLLTATKPLNSLVRPSAFRNDAHEMIIALNLIVAMSIGWIPHPLFL